MGSLAYESRSDGSNLTKGDLQSLKDSIKGKVIIKGEVDDAEYKAAVHRWNEAYSKEARIIVFAEDEEDVSNTIKFVGKHNLDVAAACGRHSYHGASSSTGLVLDLGKMRKVTIDKEAMTATAQGGCLAQDIEFPAEAEGLSVVFGVLNETGIGGLTTGGGVGWLTGQYGATLDNLLSARVALANGEIVKASETENADLFWGVRGGGSNFGICTEFVFRAHKQGPVFYQTVIFTPDRLQDCVGIFNRLRVESVEPANGKLQIMFAMFPPPGMPICPAFMVFYDGPEEEAKTLAAPIFSLGPAMVMGGMTNYTTTTGFPDILKLEGFQRYATSAAQMSYPLDESLMLSTLQLFIEVMQKYGSVLQPSKCFIDLRDYRRMASVPMDATAYANRNNVAIIGVDYQWDDPSLDKEMRAAAVAYSTHVKDLVKERKLKALVHEDGQRDITACYPNFTTGDEKILSVYGENLPRLKELKRKYDPEFMWDKWFPISPE